MSVLDDGCGYHFVPNNQNAQTHVMITNLRTARMMSMLACFKENDLAGTAWSVFLEFCVMKVKRVEEVAVVATHAVMKATPQMTCPATKWATVLPSLMYVDSTDETPRQPDR